MGDKLTILNCGKLLTFLLLFVLVEERVGGCKGNEEKVRIITEVKERERERQKVKGKDVKQSE